MGHDRVLLAVSGTDPEAWRRVLAARRPIVSGPEGATDPQVGYAVVWKQPYGLLARLPNLKAIFSVGAGVDHLLGDPDLPQVPIVRVVAPELTRYMVEYVAWRVLDHHRRGFVYRAQQAERTWREPPQPLARDITVGIMGLGELGGAAANALLGLGFTVRGWSRTARTLAGVTTFAGTRQLADFLGDTDILVVLLPLTPQTRGLIDHALLGGLRRANPLGGAVLINAGRGGLQRDADILRALDDGTLMEASLDVFEVEPLPATSALWSHPRVFITPHAAATSDPAQLAPDMLDQMDALDRGLPLRNLVDRAAGY